MKVGLPTDQPVAQELTRAVFAISGAPWSAFGASNPPSLTVLPSLSSISRRSSTLTA